MLNIILPLRFYDYGMIIKISDMVFVKPFYLRFSTDFTRSGNGFE